MITSYAAIAFVSVIFSSLAQVLLKKSSAEKKKHWVFDYLNLKVCGAYAIMFVCILLMIYSFTGMYYRYGAVIESFSYLLIMVFSWLFLKEKVTRRRVIGNGLIIMGVLIFSISV